MSDSTLDTIAIETLLARYRQVVGESRLASAELTRAFNSLRLADALRNKGTLNETHPDHPPQLALLGPTQAGKSTLLNIILDTDAAGVSALAGYTVHAVGLASGCTRETLDPLRNALLPRRRVPLVSLDANDRETYVLEPIETGAASLIDNAVIWDSPDFDSIEAGGYRGAVLMAAAMSDVLIFMLSKDKYGDRSVWDMLALLRQLGRPLLVCLNKLDATDEGVVIAAFEARHREQFDAEPPPIVTLPFMPGKTRQQHATDLENTGGRAIRIDADATPALPASVRSRLSEALAKAVAAIDRDAQARAVESWVDAEQAAWLAPVADELSARDDWDASVATVLDSAEQHYVERYLHDPRKYDTFNRALAELLNLLELPGIARSLARAREVVTWPARTLLGIGRRQLPGAKADAPDQEAEVLSEIVEQTLTKLSVLAGEYRDAAEEHAANDGRTGGEARWWQALQRELRSASVDVRGDFERESDAVRAAFEPRIEAAAQRLHEQLRRQPTLLATLRAARVTTDAAGVALAVKSGGLAPADLVLAPAMLSVTTLLTESALGRYLDTIRRDLQNEQRATVRRELFDGVIGVRLTALARSLSDATLLSQGIDKGVSDAPTPDQSSSGAPV